LAGEWYRDRRLGIVQIWTCCLLCWWYLVEIYLKLFKSLLGCVRPRVVWNFMIEGHTGVRFDVHIQDILWLHIQYAAQHAARGNLTAGVR
jgi:hypothetical protein